MEGGKIQINIRPQKDFPLMEEYSKKFAITKDTIFALGQDIYTNSELTPDLLVHEMVHLERQQIQGVKEWVYDYLESPSFRLEEEVIAYRKQIQSIKDRNYKAKVHVQSAINLSSDLYGGIISYQDAYDLLK
jgi:hypothetical protein